MRVLSPCPLLTILIFVAGCAPGVGLPGVGQPADTRPSERQQIEAICNHPWWEKKPTPAQVEKWVKTCTEMKALDTLYISKTGRAEVERRQQSVDTAFPPDDFPTPYIAVSADPNRPRTRAESLQALRIHLDYMHHQGH